ncbi:hypothetical protein GCM10009750_04690 [Agromyces salentinus]|uniref:Uncharacterized protein n=1 Tax=Agromyces salentinus TaxID=269421 RepID=A0ABN2MH12_9MICO
MVQTTISGAEASMAVAAVRRAPTTGAAEGAIVGGGGGGGTGGPGRAVVTMSLTLARGIRGHIPPRWGSRIPPGYGAARPDQPFAAFAAALAACFVARTFARDSGSTMSATERYESSSP